MTSHLLLLHGNGGANARFQLFAQDWATQPTSIQLVLPQLPGFEGRPLLRNPTDPWQPFITELASQITNAGPSAHWTLYGHGIGGSLLLEWARRGWAVPAMPGWKPTSVILHGIIGASLHKRWFPALMRPLWIRKTIQHLVANPTWQPLWERRLFLQPERIPANLKRQFFQDYQRCAAFSLFFDLITVPWYREVRATIGDQPFFFLWGDQERVVASQYLEWWEKDFPNATFEVVPGWDHFPMLETPQAFSSKLLDIITNLDQSER